VQRAALWLMLQREDRDRAKEFFDQLRFALISHDPVQFSELIYNDPQFSPSPTGERVGIAPEEDLTDTQGEWDFSEGLSPDEAMKVLSGLQTETSFLVTPPDEGSDEWR
jgi:hypothetical protein